SGVSTYYLARYLCADRLAALVSAVCFAFCPFVFAHLPHIQLLMTAGLPASMLAFHRMADAPNPARGAVLGLAAAAQAFLCGYYAIFIGLMVGFAVLVTATVGRRWRDTGFWLAVTAAVVVTATVTVPLAIAYTHVQQATGYGRSVDAA